jgi:glucuronate isomerase
MMVLFGRWDAQRGWTKQLHIGPLRNTNSRAFAKVGSDTGFDSMGDWRQADTMQAYFDFLDRQDALPKTVVYNLNPRDNYLFASMVGNFQDGVTPGKMQFGSGWWYLDQKEGIHWQLNALSNVGLLSRFVGMLTDSRSFLSCPRHEYFRRILCDILGGEMESGELPHEFELVGQMVADISYRNARNFFGLELPEQT